jgi:hypothetical protein
MQLVTAVLSEDYGPLKPCTYLDYKLPGLPCREHAHP